MVGDHCRDSGSIDIDCILTNHRVGWVHPCEIRNVGIRANGSRRVTVVGDNTVQRQNCAWRCRISVFRSITVNIQSVFLNFSNSKLNPIIDVESLSCSTAITAKNHAHGIGITTEEDILIGDPAKLQMLNDRYGTQTIIVAHALADVNGQLGVTAYIFGEEESDVIVRTYRTGEPHEDMGRVAIDEIASALAERWKQVAAVASDEKQILRVRTDYPSLKEWTRLLSRLNEAKLVREVTIVELAKSYAYLDLAYIGSVTQLGGNLGQRGLMLVEGEAGWTVVIEESAVVQ